MSHARRVAIGVAWFLVTGGCNAIGGIDPPELDPCVGSGGCQATSSSAGGGGAGSTSDASSSSSGAPQPVCGNGALEAGEQCDDGNTRGGDGCSSDCHVECTGVGLVLDPMTFHCYRIIGFQSKWDDAKSSCGHEGEHLATITAQAELDFLKPHLPGRWWLDGKRSSGMTFVWDDGEPWSFTAWKMGGPADDPKKSCVKLDGGNFDVDDCNAKMGYVCERDPAGT